jgi:hypothetical protein
MAFNVFYAWQMDTQTKLNRWFIETAIKAAIKIVRQEAQQAVDELLLERALPLPEDANVVDPDTLTDAPEDENIVFQWGAHGHIGATLIAETILERIAGCGAFIADVSFTGKTTTHDKRKKKLPNSNVMIEVGAASRLVGWERMILVMNTDYGAVIDLPFDMKHRHCQVMYSLKTWDDPNRVAKAKQLAKDIAAQLRPMYQDAMLKAAEGRRQQMEAANLTAQSITVTERPRALQIRNEFEDTLRGNKFHNFKAQIGIMALSIVPAIKPPNHVEYTSSQFTLFHNFFHPIGRQGRSQMRQVTNGTILATSFDMTPDALTYVREDGSILAARNLVYGRDEIFHMMQQIPKVDVSKPWQLGMETYQPDLIAIVSKYLMGLKELGVIGPWFVGISLLKMHNVCLIPSEQGALLYVRGSCTSFQSTDLRADMLTDTIVIAPEANISKVDELETLLKRPLKQIWKSCGFVGYPKFSNRGYEIIE